MKLYYVVGSPNCRKVHAVINHLGLAVEFEYLDFFRGDLRSAHYRAINPNAMVPALVDGDFALWESNAIMQYLADEAADDSLFPRGRRERAEIARWQSWELAHFNKAFGILAFETVSKPNFLGAPADAGLVAWSQGELARYAPILDAAVADRRFLLGDSVTLADYSVGHLEAFQDGVPFDWRPFPNVTAYFTRIRALPAWVATAPAPDKIGRVPES